MGLANSTCLMKGVIMKELSIFNQLRPVTVGFDSVFDNFERMFSDDFFQRFFKLPGLQHCKNKR